VGWRRILEGGFTPAERWVVGLEDDRSVFAKVGVTDLTAGWLRDEHRVYLQLQAGFMPRMLGWDDDDDHPILLLEDLSGGRWPPPWSEEDVRRVVGMLDDVRWSRPPDGLPSLESMRGDLASWSKVADEPESFLALGVCRRPWLDRALPALIEADRAAGLAGNELLHLDVRSDNICFAGDRTLIVDWNLACVGNAMLDQVAWIPSLLLEWGSRAHAVSPAEPELARNP
jgi:Phosphotransferase enzyme family